MFQLFLVEFHQQYLTRLRMSLLPYITRIVYNTGAIQDTPSILVTLCGLVKTMNISQELHLSAMVSMNAI